MDRPVTRAFFRGGEPDRRFVEITWIGLEVEVVTGKVGSSGRAQGHAFESVADRDAFIAKRAAKALRDGYVEGSPDDRREPEPADPEAARAEALRRKHAGVAYVPRVVEGDDTKDASKFGGTPWLPRGEAWPICGGCDQPLRFVMQLAHADVPEEARWAFRADLIQLFLCDASGKEGDPEWLCQAQGEGWEPFAKSTLVRHVRCAGPPEDIRAALPAALLYARRRHELEGMVAYCERGGDVESAAVFARKIVEERVDATYYEVPRSRADALARRAFPFPVGRVAAWVAEPEVPAYGDLDLDDVQLLEERCGLACRAGDKLGGSPRWIQDRMELTCRTCRAPMRYLFQVTSNGLSPITVGGDGLGWIFVCTRCGEATFTWQR
jgi:predicted DNA-binding WGR domain protein